MKRQSAAADAASADYHTILGVPYYCNFSTMGPQTLFYSLRPLYWLPELEINGRGDLSGDPVVPHPHDRGLL